MILDLLARRYYAPVRELPLVGLTETGRLQNTIPASSRVERGLYGVCGRRRSELHSQDLEHKKRGPGRRSPGPRAKLWKTTLVEAVPLINDARGIAPEWTVLDVVVPPLVGVPVVPSTPVIVLVVIPPPVIILVVVPPPVVVLAVVSLVVVPIVGHRRA
jgi:hypothetical protein